MKTSRKGAQIEELKQKDQRRGFNSICKKTRQDSSASKTSSCTKTIHSLSRAPKGISHPRQEDWSSLMSLSKKPKPEPRPDKKISNMRLSRANQLKTLSLKLTVSLLKTPQRFSRLTCKLLRLLQTSATFSKKEKYKTTSMRNHQLKQLKYSKKRRRLKFPS